MYTSFFGFKENPFNLTPDPRYLFLSTYHKEALDHLLYGINEKKGFITISGGIGTGKTTLCRALLSHLNAGTKSALIFNSYISDNELLRTINHEFGIEIDSSAGTKKDHIDALNQFLLKTFSSGGNAVLLIDEAQNLSDAVLEQVRMLSNLETEKEKLIQIVFIGQPELNDLLTTPSSKALNERITVRYNLKPLDPADIRGYIEHRLVVGGSQGNVTFTGRAFKAIYGYSKGNPRRINAICDRALLIAYAKEKYSVSREIVEKAIKDIRGDAPVELPGIDRFRKRLVSAGILVLLLVLAAVLAGLNFRKDILGLYPPEKKIIRVKIKDVPRRATNPKKSVEKLFLDEKTSLAGLFRLFTSKYDKKSFDLNEGHLGLFSFNMKPEFFVMLKKPFIVRLSSIPSSSLPFPCYLLISEVGAEKVIAIDGYDREQAVKNDLLFDYWGQKVSCIYPYKDNYVNLGKGVSSPDVLKVQKILSSIGYMVQSTGFYGEQTFSNVIKFQKDFSLIADGIVGIRTMALLYQMSESD